MSHAPSSRSAPPEESWAATCSAKAAVDTEPCAWSGHPGAQQSKKASSPRCRRSACSGQRAALVDAGRRTSAPGPGSASTRSWASRRSRVPVLRGRAASAAGRPTPPTTATPRSRRSPRAARCRASSDTVRLLPNHWCASSWATSRSAPRRRRSGCAPKIDSALRLERDLEVVVGDHDGVVGERVGPEQLARTAPSSRGCRPKSSVEAWRAAAAATDACMRDRRRPTHARCS